MSVSDCRLTQKHCGPGVTWLTAEVKNNGDGELSLSLSNDIPNCCFELSSVTITTLKTSTHVDQTSSLAHLSSQTPQDYGSGFLPNYSKDAWEKWLKSFELQTGTDYKVQRSRKWSVKLWNKTSVIHCFLAEKLYMQ